MSYEVSGEEGQPENRRAAATEQLFQEIIGGAGDYDYGVFNALAMLTTDAILDGDTETLRVIFDSAVSAQRFDRGCSEGTQARLSVFADLANCGISRILPEVGTAELTYLQLADGEPYHKERGSDLTEEEQRLLADGLMVYRIINNTYYMELTPRGEAALNRNRLNVEAKAR